ncbi:hypothetical protein [Ornithinicoccus halotolerans]|uniref:hypothetical protein n=1 Tax=Ornithinicoccus halotolerans TaxID=1748220 RepID=UPI001296725E|nr:hypothetical protein [Ornithinicoccus halotolerans]
MSPTRLRRWHGTVALGLTVALLLPACSEDAPDTEEADTPPASAPAEGDAAEDRTTEPGSGAGEAQGDGEQPPIESGPAPLSPGEERPEGTEVVQQGGFSVAIPEGWQDSSSQTEYHYTDPSTENRGFFVRTFDPSAGTVEESLPLAAEDLDAAGLDPTFYRVDWPGADDAALITYDDPEANPPAVHRTYQLLVETPDGSFWAAAYDEVERFDDSPVTDVLASFRPQE